MKLVPSLASLAVLAAAGVASAHHSAAMFDMTRTSTLSGQVKAFEWTNPHAWIALVAPSSNGGAPVEWRIECSSVNIIARKGWSSHVVKSGDKATIELHPARNGASEGLLMSLILPGGKVLTDHDY